MPAPRKNKTVRHQTPDGRSCPPGTPGAVKVTGETASYYGRVKQPDGTYKKVKLCPDFAKSKQMLARLLADAAMGRHGLADEYEPHRARPLLDHLADYRQELEGRGDDPRYVALVCSRLTALFDGCGFRTTADLAATPVTGYLAGLRRAGRGRVDLPAGQERFTYAEAAAVLGILPRSVTAAVRRHRLKAEGNGRARRLPRTTVEALLDRLDRGASVTTTNQYLGHLKSFARWLVQDDRLEKSPFDRLAAGNESLDRRHDRRELAADELRRLLATTRASDRVFRGLAGADRHALYLTACGTGFRAAALASLTPESFALAGAHPAVTLAARKNKSRKPKVQPLPRDLADALREYVAGKPAGEPLWPGTWARDRKAAEMLRRDLEAAGIAYSVPGPNGDLYADFHALRHSFLTALGRSGVDLRTAQTLAGHSSPVLTARYTHKSMEDLAGAVGKLPTLTPTVCCPTVVHPPDVSGRVLAFPGIEGEGGGEGPEAKKPPENQGFGRSRHSEAS